MRTYKKQKLLGEKGKPPWTRMWEWMYRSTFFDLGTSWRLVISFTPRPLYPRGESPVTHRGGGWVGPRTGLDDMEKRKFLPLPGLELRLLGRPTRSQSLYRLSHPWSVDHYWVLKKAENGLTKAKFEESGIGFRAPSARTVTFKCQKPTLEFLCNHLTCGRNMFRDVETYEVQTNGQTLFLPYIFWHVYTLLGNYRKTKLDKGCY
jgi:hypothetical protein